MWVTIRPLAPTVRGSWLANAAVMLRSVIANLSSDRLLAVHILHGGINERNRLDLMTSLRRDRVSLQFLAAKPETLAGLPLWGRMSVATYYRLLITRLLPSAVSRAIWLDCDLVVTDDLARLWDMDLAGRHALAVQDHGVPFVSFSRRRGASSARSCSSTPVRRLQTSVRGVDCRFMGTRPR